MQGNRWPERIALGQAKRVSKRGIDIGHVSERSDPPVDFDVQHRGQVVITIESIFSPIRRPSGEDLETVTRLGWLARAGLLEIIARMS